MQMPGEHSIEVMKETGFADDEIGAMREAGAAVGGVGIPPL